MIDMTEEYGGLIPLAVTSEEAGNLMSGRPGAMSAPGSEPVTPLPPSQDQGDPALEATGYGRTHLQHGALSGQAARTWEVITGRQGPWAPRP